MFETKSSHETLNELDVKNETGLSAEEVSKRTVKYGLNKLQEKKKKSLVSLFFSQLNDPMIYILLGAAFLSLVISIYSGIVSKTPLNLSDFADTIIILAVVILNSTIGTIQESKAEKSLEALKRLSSPTALVRREGKIIEIKAEELVPGDIVILEEGRTVPADLRLITSINLKTDESSLTGESLPVEKNADYVFSKEVGAGDRINCVYSSTPVVYGRGEGVVVATGMNTETGKIAKLLSDSDSSRTPLQKKLAGLSKFLGILTIVIVLLLFGVQMLQLFVLNPLAGVNIGQEIVNDFLFAISLAVAAVPEGLPAVVTIVLSLGVQRMVKANTIVRKLPSVETLGSVTYVCSDKTGTLTQNKMTIVRTYVNQNIYSENQLLDAENKFMAAGMSLCSNASTENGSFGDPTEIALVEYANKLGLEKSILEKDSKRIDEIPFDSIRKMMSTQHIHNNKKMVFTKGAMDSLLKCCSYILIDNVKHKITDEYKSEIIKASDLMAKDALRVLAFAYKESDTLEEKDLIFVGLVGMIDPPRQEAKRAVDIFKEAGITTVMITGDHKTTALAIANKLGITSDSDLALSGDEIDLLTQEELKEKVKTVRVFARVSPQNKVQIVNAIQENGNIVAMTGDGVNDAPSLKNADIGIAMGITGTDVAKSAADMVLTDDNFASIEKAVEEGRGVYTNIKKTILFLLGSNLAEVLTMFICVCMSLPTPLIAIHVLWVNLITDSLPAIALGADPKEKGIMKEKPRSPKESLFSRGGAFIMVGYGILITACTLAAYLLVPYIQSGGSDLNIILKSPGYEHFLVQAQTAAFCVLALSELTHMLGMTSQKKSFIHNFWSKNWLLWVAFICGVGLQFFVVETPGVNEFFKCSPDFNSTCWIIVICLSLVPLAVHEIVAFILYIVDKVKRKSSKIIA